MICNHCRKGRGEAGDACPVCEYPLIDYPIKPRPRLTQEKIDKLVRLIKET